ncbi:MAG TPA: DUF6065 family protein [Casimicrobium sp.]|nr:DUF6065 family protein [Casimicrobium sp.]
MITVPANHIAALPYDNFYKSKQDELFVNLNGVQRREWFSKHAYLCLPLIMGNQHGFAMRSIIKATLVWNGGPEPSDTTITIHNTEELLPRGPIQTISSHFGLGIVTVQTAFALRTPPGVSLMTIQPPNLFIDGVQNMTAVVESDNLRRDFTFNLKLTRAHYPVNIDVGDVLSAVLPYPRGFIDNFQLVDAYELFTEAQIKEEQITMAEFGKERREVDPSKKRGVGRRYFDGEDIYGNKFPNAHQVRLGRDQTPEE